MSYTFAKDRNKRTLDYYILNIYLWFQGGRTRQQPVLARSRTIFDNFDPFLAILTLRGPCFDPSGAFFYQNFSCIICPNIFPHIFAKEITSKSPTVLE